MTYTFEIGQTILTDSQSHSDFVALSYVLTTDHAASNYDVPVLVAPDGAAYGPEDVLPLRGDTAREALEWSLYGGGFLGTDEDFDAAVAACRRFGTM